MYGPKWLDVLNQYSTHHTLRDYSAGGDTRCEDARLEAMLAARRLLGWRRCSLRGGSARGIPHCKYL
ncbi:hypothetical protein EV2_027127 [Malus domestica]